MGMEYVSNQNPLGQIMQAMTFAKTLPYIKDTRDTIAKYADSPILSYTPYDIAQSMKTYEKALNRQAEMKLMDIKAQTGGEHSFGSRLAQMDALQARDTALNSIAAQKVAAQRQAIANDWMNANARRAQAVGADVASLTSMLGAQTMDTTFQKPTTPLDYMTQMGSMGSSIMNWGQNLIGNARNQ